MQYFGRIMKCNFLADARGWPYRDYKLDGTGFIATGKF